MLARDTRDATGGTWGQLELSAGQLDGAGEHAGRFHGVVSRQGVDGQAIVGGLGTRDVDLRGQVGGHLRRFENGDIMRARLSSFRLSARIAC